MASIRVAFVMHHDRFQAAGLGIVFLISSPDGLGIAKQVSQILLEDSAAWRSRSDAFRIGSRL